MVVIKISKSARRVLFVISMVLLGAAVVVVLGMMLLGHA